MIAKLAVAVVAIAIAGVVTRSLWGSEGMLGKILAALVGIGLAAYGVALVVANGSC